jgi:hypothetical protein
MIIDCSCTCINDKQRYASSTNNKWKIVSYIVPNFCLKMFSIQKECNKLIMELSVLVDWNFRRILHYKNKGIAKDIS